MRFIIALALPVLSAAIFLQLGLLVEALGVGTAMAVCSLLLVATDRSDAPKPPKGRG